MFKTSRILLWHAIAGDPFKLCVKREALTSTSLYASHEGEEMPSRPAQDWSK
jgi:hypothetical protein